MSLILLIDSVIRLAGPRKEVLRQIIEEIEDRRIFEGEPCRLQYEQERLGRFTIDRTKTIFTGQTQYVVLDPYLLDSDRMERKIVGHKIRSKDGEVIKAFRILNPRDYQDGHLLPCVRYL